MIFNWNFSLCSSYLAGHSAVPLRMSSMMLWGWWPSTLLPTDWAVPRISLMVPESSLAKDQFCICPTMLTISTKVIFPLCLMLFCLFVCLLLSHGGSLRALMMGQRQKALPQSGPVCSDGQVHCNPQTLPVTGCFGDIITNLFWRHAQGADLEGQGRCGTNFPNSAPQV